MADSVLKLKVDDKEYNASLKNAKTGMQALEASLQKAGKTFNDCDKKVVEYVRAIGQMETQSKSARGRIGEMSTAFVELSQQYNKMSKDVQQGDVGKALSESMQTLKQRTIEAKQELKGLEDQLREVGNSTTSLPSGSSGGLFGGGKLDGMLQVFGGNLMTKGFEMATGAAMNFINTIKDAAAQGIEMARSGEGIRNAFDRLNEPGLLDNLRQATHGTVTNLELMKAAVKFNDFKLSLDQLGTMLAFAQQKAKDTGQSVDYMVDSIVTGLGRKSLMILDNLGLSANEVKEKMKETGDMTTAVGEIIREQMSQAGDYIETAADKATAADVDLKNAMEDLGRTLLPLQEQGEGMWNALEIGALKLLNEGITPLVPALLSLKETIGDIAETVSNSAIWDGYVTALGAVADKAAEMIPVLGKAYTLLKMIRSGGSDDMGAGVGAAISGAISADAGVLPDVVITPTKKTTKTTGGKGGSGKTPEEIISAQYEKAMLKANAIDPSTLRATESTGPSQMWSVVTEEMKKGAEDSMSNLTSWTKNFNPYENDKRRSNPFLSFDKSGNATAKMTDIMGGISNGINSMVGGLEQMGVEIPEGIKQGLSFMQGITSILTGIATTVLAIEAISGADFLIPFARGGIAHAANGWVGGNRNSTDDIPVAVSSGELILNRAQQGNLASQLSEQGGGGGVHIAGILKGEDIVLMADRWGKRTGRGELLFAKNL